MSRSAEDQQLLEQRIQAMKLKNEELRRRHLEVEADKQTAAKQNALVKTNAPIDDDWIPGRHDDNPRQDRNHQIDDAPNAANYERNEEKGPRFDNRRNRAEAQRGDNGSYNRQYEEPATFSRSPQHSQNYSGRRNDFPVNRQKFDGDRYHGNENRRSGEWSSNANDSHGGRSNERGSYANRGFRGNAPVVDSSRGHSSTYTSKVFKNSAMDSDRGKRSSYRLAEGDGPPPDPSYSFLGDDMRDSPESVEKRRGSNRRGFPRARGRGGQTWNNRNFNDSRVDGFENRPMAEPRHHEDSKQQSYEAWRRERNIIDQERINRQKRSDGNWSREWDNNKVFQESNDRPHRWRRGNQTQSNERGHSRRGFHDDTGYVSKQNFVSKSDSMANTSSRDVESDQVPSENKFIRRGRFTNQSRFRDNSKFINGSMHQTPLDDKAASKEAADAALIESNVKTVEELQVSVVCDSSGTEKRCVEGVGGNLRISVSQDEESSEIKPAEQRRIRKSIRKGKRTRVLSTTSTGTTGTPDEGDGSWEDVSSEEEDVSVVTELRNAPRQDMGTPKCVDVSSGPESLDPIPAPGKEDEFLWDDFHPAGFQDNATLVMDAEAAYQALLDEKAKQEITGDDAVNNESQPPKVSFRLDTSCLEDSGDEFDGAKLDPLLVTTQIVQAEVDCMSLTSIPTDTSLPDDVSQYGKVKVRKDENIPEEEGCSSAEPKAVECGMSPEELSGPVSILEISSNGSSKDDSNKHLSEAEIEVKKENNSVSNEEKGLSSAAVTAESTQPHELEPQTKSSLKEEVSDLQDKKQENSNPAPVQSERENILENFQKDACDENSEIGKCEPSVLTHVSDPDCINAKLDEKEIIPKESSFNSEVDIASIKDGAVGILESTNKNVEEDKGHSSTSVEGIPTGDVLTSGGED